MTDNTDLIVAALIVTNPVLAAEMDAENSFRTDVAQQGARVKLYRDYERGDHRAVITTQMRNMLRLPEDETGMSDLNDNYMRLIVDKMASRLHVSSISISAGKWTGLLKKMVSEIAKINSAVAIALQKLLEQLADAIDSTLLDDWVAQLMQRNDFDALQGVLFRGAIRDGECFAMVDPMTLRWSAEAAYDGFSGVVAITDATSKIPVWAVKLWAESNTADANDASTSLMKLVVYQPGSVTYWQGEEGTKEVRPDDKFEVSPSTIGIEGDVPMVTNQREWKIGKVPLVHFVNQYDTFAPGGESELRPAIPLQDVLNRTIHSMVSTSEFSAFPIKWSIGMEIDANGITPGAVINLTLKDKTGNIITEMTPETVEFLKAVRVGQFEAANTSEYINQIDRIVREISQNTQTPIYGITAQGNISGDALRQLEVGLIGKVERFQRQNTDAIRELIILTSQIQNAFVNNVGSAPVFEEVSLTWKSAELLDATAQIDILVKMRKDAPGLWTDDFYRARIGALLGMAQQKIDAEGDAAQQQQQNNIESLVGAGGDTLPIV